MTVLVLESVSLLRKYLGVLDVPLSALRRLVTPHHQCDRLECHAAAARSVRERMLLASGCAVCDCTALAFMDFKAAMAAYRTQEVWYRALFMSLSRYVYVNTLREL